MNITQENRIYFRQMRNFTNAATRRGKNCLHICLQFLHRQRNTYKFFKALNGFKIEDSVSTDILSYLSDANEVNHFFSTILCDSKSDCSRSIHF